ncbi:MAG: N-acetyltransferase family protein [Acidobacteriota bacterium]|nr:N-acetyltransferase family protein [Acidobacteriota bacterium]
MKIRMATAEDAPAIAAIYNFYVQNSIATFEIESVGESEMRRRVSEILESYPFLVCEENGEILGYASASLYKTRPAYRHSVEISVYLKNGTEGKGVGSILYEHLFAELKTKPVHAIIAGISLPNEPSVHLHEKFGFEKVAHFREVGFKFGHWIDVGYWEKIQN